MFFRLTELNYESNPFQEFTIDEIIHASLTVCCIINLLRGAVNTFKEAILVHIYFINYLCIILIQCFNRLIYLVSLMT